MVSAAKRTARAIRRRGSGSRCAFCTTDRLRVAGSGAGTSPAAWGPASGIASNMRQPAPGELAALAARGLEERLLDPLGRGAHAALADLPSVDFADRRDLRRGAAEERLVRDVE